MFFDDFLKETGKSDAEAGDELDYTPECIRLWRLGQRTPRPKAMARISEWSGGKVLPKDWYDLPEIDPGEDGAATPSAEAA